MRALGLVVLLAGGTAHAQQDLGRRLPGSAGLDAGSQAPVGLYLGDRLVMFGSSEVNDRHGETVPIENLDIDALANVVGLAGTVRMGDVYASASVGAPAVQISVRAGDARASLDRFGLGDVFVEPIKLGRRGTRFDVVGAYALYIPTGAGETEGIGRRQWSHQVSAGGTLFFDDRRGWRVSAIASYLHNRKKIGIEITRGDSIQIQGGMGGPILTTTNTLLELGLAGFVVRQVRDDRGADLPMLLRGARERAYGLGPELGFVVPSLRVRVTARVEWDVAGVARPVGTLLIVGLSYVLWK